MILKDKSNKNNHKKVLSLGIEHAHTKPTTSCRLKKMRITFRPIQIN